MLHVTPTGLDAIGFELAPEPEAAVEYRFNESANSAGEPAPKRPGARKKAAPRAPDTGAPRTSREVPSRRS